MRRKGVRVKEAPSHPAVQSGRCSRDGKGRKVCLLFATWKHLAKLNGFPRSPCTFLIRTEEVIPEQELLLESIYSSRTRDL